MRVKFLMRFLSFLFFIVPFASAGALESQAIIKSTEKRFEYETKIMENTLTKATELTEDLIRRLENIEENQRETLLCARQDAPVDPDSYSIWGNGRGACVTVTRSCVDGPENPIESRELVFIFDASSSMKSTYKPPVIKNTCKHYYSRYKSECGGQYYPAFKDKNPIHTACGRWSTSKFCRWCGYKPNAPTKKVVTSVKLNGEGIPYNVYGNVYVTEGPAWESYLATKNYYESCNQKNRTTKCAHKFNTCKSTAKIDFADEIAARNAKYRRWKTRVYDPYTVCRNKQYKEYLSCVNNFNSIWNTEKPAPRISAAKKAVSNAIKNAPTFVDLGLVVFNGCEEIINHGFYLDGDRTDLLKAVNAIDATGTTPLVDSMIIAAENMKIKEEGVNAEGYIVLVTDGEDTCVSKDRNVSIKAVCNTAKALKKENDGLVINVLDLSNNSRLSCISEYTGGVYASVSNEGTMLTAIVQEMSKISDIPEYCYASNNVDWPDGL